MIFSAKPSFPLGYDYIPPVVEGGFNRPLRRKIQTYFIRQYNNVNFDYLCQEQCDELRSLKEAPFELSTPEGNVTVIILDPVLNFIRQGVNLFRVSFQAREVVNQGA